MKKGVNIKFNPILFLSTSFFLIQETPMSINIPVSKVSVGACWVYLGHTLKCQIF